MPTFDSESARAAGRKSGQRRRRKKNPDGDARDALLQGAGDAANTLVEVIRGSAGFEDVKPELRVKAALVVLEYVLGKPAGFLGDEGEEAPAEPDFASLLKKSDPEPPKEAE